jgi:hypothetical protein
MREHLDEPLTPAKPQQNGIRTQPGDDLESAAAAKLVLVV